MHDAYDIAIAEIVASINKGGSILDCGAHSGRMYDLLRKEAPLDRQRYYGVEWNREAATKGRNRGLQITCANLNEGIPHEDNKFSCVFGLSLLEHLLTGCRFLVDTHRVLTDDGKLVILTPNISTYFTAALILMGKMPSSGPHPDSEALLRKEELFEFRDSNAQLDIESDTPVHRHLVVFSYRVLRNYLEMIGFTRVQGYGFGLYPFPKFLQPVLQRVDPYHCHQMVFVAHK